MFFKTKFKQFTTNIRGVFCDPVIICNYFELQYSIQYSKKEALMSLIGLSMSRLTVPMNSFLSPEAWGWQFTSEGAPWVAHLHNTSKILTLYLLIRGQFLCLTFSVPRPRYPVIGATCTIANDLTCMRLYTT